MTRFATIVAACALLAAFIAAPAGAQVSITEKQAAESYARSVFVHRSKVKPPHVAFNRNHVKISCKRQRGGYWKCAINAANPSTGTSCIGKVRVYGHPGSFKARKLVFACAA
jgi:hypothetical protein